MLCGQKQQNHSERFKEENVFEIVTGVPPASPAFKIELK